MVKLSKYNNLIYIICSDKVKYAFIIAFLLFIYIGISAISYADSVSDNISSGVFRLHVIANSDSEEDQKLKYIVRDAILDKMNTKYKSVSTKEELVSMLNLEEIRNIAKQTIIDEGYSYDVSVEIGNFAFPTKTYGDISLPSGLYDALRVKIGQAEGKNWWCVMFPPLCFVDVSSGIVPEDSKNILKNSMGSEEYELISDKNSNDISFKFKLIEMFQKFKISIANKG